MQSRNLGHWLVLGLAVVALSVRGHADSFTYTYTGLEFGDSDLTNNVSDLYQFLATDSVTATVTLDAAIPSSSFTDYLDTPGFTQELLSWSITAGGVTFSSDDPNAGLQSLFFGVTGTEITSWDMSAVGVPASAPADLSYMVISTENTDEGTLDDGYLESKEDAYNVGGIFNSPGTWSESESSSVPEPATITMLIGGLAFLGKKRASGRRATR
jgi:hypothetical protein